MQYFMKVMDEENMLNVPKCHFSSRGKKMGCFILSAVVKFF